MKQKLPSLSRIKKALYADWSLRVRTRDGFKCLLCGATENLTSHHWYCSDHHAHAARYAIANGATLCYACHIRGIHTRADFVSVKKLADVLKVTFDTMSGIELLIKQELTTALLRELWDAMRKRPVTIAPFEIIAVKNKVFALDAGPQKAVVGNVIKLTYDYVAPYRDILYEVATIVKIPIGYRYTLKKLEDPS